MLKTTLLFGNPSNIHASSHLFNFMLCYPLSLVQQAFGEKNSMSPLTYIKSINTMAINHVLQGQLISNQSGDVISSLGSGSRKSTLLRCINGLEQYARSGITV